MNHASLGYGARGVHPRAFHTVRGKAWGARGDRSTRARLTQVLLLCCMTLCLPTGVDGALDDYSIMIDSSSASQPEEEEPESVPRSSRDTRGRGDVISSTGGGEASTALCRPARSEVSQL